MREKIRKILLGTISLFIVVMLVVVGIIHIKKYESEYQKHTNNLFTQIEQVLEQNQVVGRNQLSYIFSMLSVHDDSIIAAIDAKQGTILGSTKEDILGESIVNLGLTQELLEQGNGTKFFELSGESRYGVYREADDVILIRVIKTSALYEGLAEDIVVIGICLLIATIVLALIIEGFLEKYIVSAINQINKTLTDGEMDEMIDVRHTHEFEVLSECINTMKRRLIAERDVDSLTGILNRRGLDVYLDKIYDDKEIIQHAALIMIDVDGLKQINDNYGHRAGDKYLKKAVSVFEGLADSKTVIARQGGDEFVIFHYGEDADEAVMKFIERLEAQQDVHDCRINEELTVKVRFSFGYVLCKDRSEKPSTLLREADANMYQQKKMRKNEQNR